MVVSFIALGLSVGALAMAQTVATHDPAVAAIDAAIKSLREMPNQYMLSISTSGVTVNNSGGTGIKIDVQGGGPGSTTIGMRIDNSVTQQQTAVAYKTADEAVKKESERAIGILTEIKTLIQKQPAQIDKPAVSSKLVELGKTFLVPVVVSVIQAIVKTRLGLP